MTLYKLKTVEEDIHVYSRDPTDIMKLVSHYMEQRRRASNWLMKLPTLEEIEEVRNGKLRFQNGGIDFSGDRNEEFFERLQAASDFTVYVNRESFTAFDLMRQGLPQNKRADLYKIQVESTLFPSLNFVPEDIMQGIVAYDLTSLVE
ncbi:MAG: hypothetical protein CMH64_01135 [Nanoarchaeota archaeon]|nr:hypothetical protein [Nanoarchaeota archaeon]|tara:strand:+ start:1108 stop:1548 length:441 start_codon:yes stop_codon:yes gene_type:complete